MVGLNRRAYRSVFVELLMGVVPVSGTLGLLALWPFEGAARALTLAGYVAIRSVFAVTGLGNIPMNARRNCRIFCAKAL